MTNYRTEVMSYDLLAAGDPTTAAYEADDAIRQWSHGGFQAQHLFALIANVRIDLYRGMGADARADGRLRSAYYQSGLNESCIARVNFVQLIACSGLSTSAKGPGGSEPLREASAAAGRLERERFLYARALATMIRGRVASIRGDANTAITCYRHAAAAFRTLQMPLYEAATLFRLGDLLSSDDGADLIHQATHWLESQQVRDPISMVRMILP